MLARRYSYEFGGGREQLAEVAMAVRAHANRNPAALMYNKTMSFEDYMSARFISEPLCLFDNCLETDGALAVVLVSAERAKDGPHPPALVHAFGQGLHRQHEAMVNYYCDDPLQGPAWAAAKKLWSQSDLGPADIDVAQIYDAFTPLILLSLEGYGFCGRGEAGDFVLEGICAGGVERSRPTPRAAGSLRPMCTGSTSSPRACGRSGEPRLARWTGRGLVLSRLERECRQVPLCCGHHEGVHAMSEGMQITIDWDKCMGSGNRMFWAPDTFELGDDGHAVILDPTATDDERLKVAAEGCPVGAIALSRTAWPSRLEKGRPSAHCTDRRSRGAAPHGRPLAGDALPPERAPHRCGGGNARIAARVGKDGGPGLARPAPPRSVRGAGFGLEELAVVLEELGYSLFPGPVLTTALLGAIVARYGNDAQRVGLSPGFGRRQHSGRACPGCGHAQRRCARTGQRHAAPRARCADRRAHLGSPVQWHLVSRRTRRARHRRESGGPRRHPAAR